jgi:hypothetical protein
MSNGSNTAETEEAEYAPVNRVVGVAATATPQVARAAFPARSGALPPTINYETLITDARSSGFEVRCIGFVEGPTNSMIVVLKRKDGLWEAFHGVHHRLERLALEPRASFNFGGGIFISGKNQAGEPVSLMVPESNRENLGLTATFNGIKIRRF